MNDLKLNFYQDKKSYWRWRLVAGNGKQISRSPGYYKTTEEMMCDIHYLVKKEYDAELYQDKRGEWRWRLCREVKNPATPLKARNIYRTIAISSEGYKNRADCKHGSDLTLDSTLTRQAK